MRYTDKTIPITCGECSEVVDGIDAMAGHIFDVHPTYSTSEVKHYARIWADDAYELIEIEEQDLVQQRKQEDRDD